MGTYTFEFTGSFSDSFEIEADSYEDAMAEAIAEGEQFLVIAGGLSVGWDYTDIACTDEPDEDY